MKQEEIFAREFGISVEQAKEALLWYASQWGGCVSCRHSQPSTIKKSWVIRSCPFGMRQENCTLYEEIRKE